MCYSVTRIRSVSCVRSCWRRSCWVRLSWKWLSLSVYWEMFESNRTVRNSKPKRESLTEMPIGDRFEYRGNSRTVLRTVEHLLDFLRVYRVSNRKSDEFHYPGLSSGLFRDTRNTYFKMSDTRHGASWVWLTLPPGAFVQCHAVKQDSQDRAPPPHIERERIFDRRGDHEWSGMDDGIDDVGARRR